MIVSAVFQGCAQEKTLWEGKQQTSNHSQTENEPSKDIPPFREVIPKESNPRIDITIYPALFFKVPASHRSNDASVYRKRYRNFQKDCDSALSKSSLEGSCGPTRDLPTLKVKVNPTDTLESKIVNRDPISSREKPSTSDQTQLSKTDGEGVDGELVSIENIPSSRVTDLTDTEFVTSFADGSSEIKSGQSTNVDMDAANGPNGNTDTEDRSTTSLISLDLEPTSKSSRNSENGIRTDETALVRSNDNADVAENNMKGENAMAEEGKEISSSDSDDSTTYLSIPSSSSEISDTENSSANDYMTPDEWIALFNSGTVSRQREVWESRIGPHSSLGPRGDGNTVRVLSGKRV